MEKPSQSVIAGSAATLFGTAISALLAMAYISLGARWLGPSAYADVAAAIALANIVFIALNPLEAGLTLKVAGYAGRRELAQLHDFLMRGLRGLALVALSALSVWIGAIALSGAPSGQGFLALFCCASLLSNMPRAALRGREQFSELAANWILESLVRMAVGLGLVQLGLGAVGMIAGYGLGMAVAVVHGALSAQRGLPPRVEQPRRANNWLADVVLPMRSLSAPLVGLHLYTALVVNVDVLCARRYLSSHEAGIYGGSASIARIVLVGAHPLLLVLFSRLASMSAARSDTRRTLRLGALLVLGGLALSMLVPIFASDLVLRGFLGTAYRGASEVLLFQWATAAVLIAQAFFAESMLATSNLRGGFLCIVPAIALIAGLFQWHDDAVMIARTCFVVCATLGTATFYLLWRFRTPLAAGA